MEQKRRKQIRPIVIFLIGILLIVLSFVFWFYAVPPIGGLATYSLDRPATSVGVNTTASFIEYFGHNEALNPTPFNQSRPIDYLFNTTLNLKVTTGGPVNVTVYVGNQAVFNVITNTTMREIICNTTTFLSYIQNGTIPPAGVFPNIVSNVTSSWFDAFTGGPSPYMLVKNLNSTVAAGVSYSFSYNGVRRVSSGIPLFMFIIGVIIIVIESIVLLRILIKHIRER